MLWLVGILCILKCSVLADHGPGDVAVSRGLLIGAHPMKDGGMRGAVIGRHILRQQQRRTQARNGFAGERRPQDASSSGNVRFFTWTTTTPRGTL